MKNIIYLISTYLILCAISYAQNIVRTNVNEHTLRIEFDQPMDRTVVLDSAANISPAVCGTWAWQDDSILTFTADSFADNTFYIVTLLSRLVDAKKRAISPYSFYFVHHKDDYRKPQITREPLEWEDVEVWDTEVDWQKGIRIQTVKPEKPTHEKEIKEPQYVLYFLWEKEFYGPLRDWKGEPIVISSYTEKQWTIIVTKGRVEKWRKTLDWQQCYLVGTDDYVARVAAVGETIEGQRLYVFEKTGKMLFKYPLANCGIIDFSPVGKYLIAVSSTNDLYLFNTVAQKLLWRRELQDSTTVVAAAVSAKGDVMTLLKNTEAQSPAYQNTFMLFDKDGAVVWQCEFLMDYRMLPMIRFTADDEYFLIYHDNRLKCYKVIR